ncbi:MAG: sulfatase-like hydrolase/transferase, partial [Planctomycetes bacterium]|nr:sulfatase-like hydrolase/transferase [Planctomycetota bacterium]
MVHRGDLEVSMSLLGVLLSASAVFAADEGRRPNVVFILTDNQSAWTLGCYGNPDIRTPNIDRLAAQGIRFTNCFSCNAVCSPTRATCLTGLIPSQHGVHSYLGGGALVGPDAYYTLEEFRTLPAILHEAGYMCGMTGKWHLGECLHPQDGFTAWVTMPTGHTTTFYDAQVVEDGKIRKEPTYLTDFWTRHAVRFIEQNKD